MKRKHAVKNNRSERLSLLRNARNGILGGTSYRLDPNCPAPGSPFHAYRWIRRCCQQGLDKARQAIAPAFADHLSFNSGPGWQRRRSATIHTGVFYEPLEDRRVLSTFTVTSALDTVDPGDGALTLREAIVAANDTAEADTIEFNIAGFGVHTISPTSALPAIINPLTIDGSSQPGYSDSPLIEVSGASAGSNIYGFAVYAQSTISGLNINEYSWGSIVVGTGGSNTVITDNFIGTDPTGTLAIGGGTLRIAGGLTHNVQVIDNLISGNTGAAGIEFVSAGTAVIQGNKIGTDVTGTVALPNRNGISMDLGFDNLIGGTEPGQGNVISGNDWNGIEIARNESTGNRIEGNLIGTDVTGTLDLGNYRSGISLGVGANSNTIGGSVSDAGNVISGNQFGISLGGGGSNVIQGNLIGTDVSGTNPVGNIYGVEIGSNNNRIVSNVIAGYGPGVSFGDASYNVVQDNMIGTDASGTLDLGNGDGVLFQDGAANNNQVLSNVIHNSNGFGISTVNADNAAILSNSIYNTKGIGNNRSGLGIDIGGDDVTGNDANDADNIQNYPVLTSVISGGGVTTIQGSLSSTADSDFVVQLFANEVTDVSGFGEGQLLIDSIDVSTNESGIATFQVSVNQEFPAGYSISATATRMLDDDGNTVTAPGSCEHIRVLTKHRHRCQFQHRDF